MAGSGMIYRLIPRHLKLLLDFSSCNGKAMWPRLSAEPPKKVCGLSELITQTQLKRCLLVINVVNHARRARLWL